MPVVVLPDIYGPSDFYRELAARLAAAGHDTTLADHHFREGPLAEATREAAFARRARMDEVQALDDVRHLIATLRHHHHPHHDHDRAGSSAGNDGNTGLVGVVGFCLAGQFALVLAATETALPTVSFYGFPEGVPGEVVRPAPRPVDLAESIRNPVLAMWGAEDYISREVIDRFAARAAEAPAPVEVRVFDGAGHSFLQGLVEARPDTPAAQTAWDLTVNFLKEQSR